MAVDWAKHINQLICAAMQSSTQPVNIDTDRMCQLFREATGITEDQVSNKTIKNQFSAWKAQAGLGKKPAASEDGGEGGAKKKVAPKRKAAGEGRKSRAKKVKAEAAGDIDGPAEGGRVDGSAFGLKTELEEMD